MPTRLLLAEDEPVIRLDEKLELERLGYLVVAAVADGASAVARARELRPDLVIMCIRMPEMDGLTASEILNRERIAPVMLVTAMNDESLIARAREAGVVMYVTKPWRASDMRPSIEMALARHREFVALENNVNSLEEQLATRKLVERAVGILIARHGLPEQQAFRKIAKLSMNHRKPMKDVAEAILLTEELADDTPPR